MISYRNWVAVAKNIQSLKFSAATRRAHNMGLEDIVNILYFIILLENQKYILYVILLNI